MDGPFQKAKEDALRWHFGLITDPPVDVIGREFLATVMPLRYSLRDELLVWKKDGQPAKAKPLAASQRKANRSFRLSCKDFITLARKAQVGKVLDPGRTAPPSSGILSKATATQSQETTKAQEVDDPRADQTMAAVAKISGSLDELSLKNTTQDSQTQTNCTRPALVNTRPTGIRSHGSEQTATAPLISGANIEGMGESTFNQYGLLADKCMDPSATDYLNPLSVEDSRIFQNVNAPSSAFICGSQGSGKSHTLACMLENCLMQTELGRLPNPLAALVFHYDTFTSYTSSHVCEAAYLCSSGVPVRVLVAPTNYSRMKDAYENLPDLPAGSPRPKVIEMKFEEGHLDSAKMMIMMAVHEAKGDIPLCIEGCLSLAVHRILREMATLNRGGPGLDYNEFLRRINAESFTGQQLAPLAIRLSLLESFMYRPTETKHTEPSLQSTCTQSNRTRDEEQALAWKFEPGTLTIVDLSCPFVTDSAACSLFSICLDLFLERRGNVSRIVALDEAHKVISNLAIREIRSGTMLSTSLFPKFLTSSASAAAFTEKLLHVIRLQRHLATRMVVATQEPTISTKFLDLSSMTIVHRFTSPEWYQVLRSHLAGMSSPREAGTANAGDARKVDQIFDEIVELDTGEALLFSPSALLGNSAVTQPSDTGDGKKADVTPRGAIVPKKLGRSWLKMKVRNRLTEDGGRSIMAG